MFRVTKYHNDNFLCFVLIYLVIGISLSHELKPAINEDIDYVSELKKGGAKNKGIQNVMDDIEDGYFPDVPCESDSDCLDVLPGVISAYNMSKDVAHAPVCKDNSTTLKLADNDTDRMCSCGTLCLSKSWNSNGEFYMYYCGPCGRVGSECRSQRCYNKISACDDKDGYCECIDDGSFQDLYNCIIPYYGYEIAVQMALTACIIIALCLLLAIIYNYIWVRGRVTTNGRLARFLRRNSGVTESPSTDTPPKYDDVVDTLPSYQEALQMRDSDKEMTEVQGIVNPSFEDDPPNSTNPPPPPYTSTIETSKAESQGQMAAALSSHTDLTPSTSNSNHQGTEDHASNDQVVSASNPTPSGGVIPKRRKRIAPKAPATSSTKETEEITVVDWSVGNDVFIEDRRHLRSNDSNTQADSQPIFKPLISETNYNQVNI